MNFIMQTRQFHHLRTRVGADVTRAGAVRDAVRADDQVSEVRWNDRGHRADSRSHANSDFAASHSHLPAGLDHPVMGCVGVDPLGSSRSKPSGVCSWPGAVPGLPVVPYCHTSAPVAGSIATIRLL